MPQPNRPHPSSETASTGDAVQGAGPEANEERRLGPRAAPGEASGRKSRGLGRGLSALLGAPEPPVAPHAHPSAPLDGESAPANGPATRPATPPEAAASESAEPTRLSPAAIEPNPFQPRLTFDPVKLAELADSIRTHGVLQPLIVRRIDSGYQLVSGERRWRASQQAGLVEIPVVVKDLSDREMLEVALVENVQREDITPLEAAAAYQRMAQEFALTQEEIAKRVGKSRAAVANTLRLLGLSSEIRGALADGRITEGHARALLGIPDPAERDRTLARLLHSGGTVRDAERAAKQSRNPTPAPPPTSNRAPSRRDPHVLEVETRLRALFSSKVEVNRTRSGRGVIAIEFYDDEDLNRILDTLGLTDP